MGGVPRRASERTASACPTSAFRCPCKLLGTHRAALEGLPATNRFLVVHCIAYAEVQDDRVFRARVFF